MTVTCLGGGLVLGSEQTLRERERERERGRERKAGIWGRERERETMVYQKKKMK